MKPAHIIAVPRLPVQDRGHPRQDRACSAGEDSSRVCQKTRAEVQALVSFSGDLHMSIGLMICQKGHHDDVISDNRSTIFTFYIHQVFERLQFPQALAFRLS